MTDLYPLGVAGALNRIAGTDGLGEQGAANIAAGRVNRLEYTGPAPLMPTGALAETFARAGNYSLNSAALTSGTMHMSAIALPEGITVTSISFMSGTQAAVTPTAWWFALYNSSRQLIAQTADQTSTAWGTNTVKTVALSAPQTTTYSGLHYLACCVVAGTAPSLIVAAPTSVLAALTPTIAGNSTTGLTTTAPATGAALSGGHGTLPYAYVS